MSESVKRIRFLFPLKLAIEIERVSYVNIFGPDFANHNYFVIWSHVHVLDVVEDECAWRAVAHHLLVDLVAVGGEQRLPVALVQAVRRHCVRL